LKHRGEDNFFNREIQALLSEVNVERHYAGSRSNGRPPH
jgi:hypothetical protein